MKLLNHALFALAVSLLIAGCGEDSSSKDDIPPQPPVVVQRSDDGILPQQGIRPEPVSNPESHFMRIEWQRNPEDDVAGYRIYRGSVDPAEGTRYPLKDLRYGQGWPPRVNETIHSWIDTGVDQFGNSVNILAPELGEVAEFFWQVRAFDEADNFSEFSDSIRYTLIENPYDLDVAETGGSHRLSWKFPLTGQTMYKIRVYSGFYGPDSAHWDPPLFPRYTMQESIFLNFDGNALRPFETDCTYVWQLNAIRGPLQGSAVYHIFNY